MSNEPLEALSSIPAVIEPIVNYVMQEGSHPKKIRRAIVTRIVDNAKGTVDLLVMPDPGDFDTDELFFRKEGVGYSKAKTYVTWHLIGE